MILDLANLPERKGLYSTVPRLEVDGVSFLRDFAGLISSPVIRDEREHIDYLPTQVFTEFLRDSPFGEERLLDGVRYRSATRVAGANIFLFATQNDVIDGAQDADVRAPYSTKEQTRWLRLVNVEQVSNT